jgi:hypothetical protein
LNKQELLNNKDVYKDEYTLFCGIEDVEKKREEVIIPLKVTDLASSTYLSSLSIVPDSLDSVLSKLPIFSKITNFLYVIFNNHRISLITYSLRDTFVSLRKKLGELEKIKDLDRIHLKSLFECRQKTKHDKFVLFIHTINENDLNSNVGSFVNISSFSNECISHNLVLCVEVDVNMTVLFPVNKIIVKERVGGGKMTVSELINKMMDVFYKWPSDLKFGKEKFDVKECFIVLTERIKSSKKNESMFGMRNNSHIPLLYPFTDVVEDFLEPVILSLFPNKKDVSSSSLDIKSDSSHYYYSYNGRENYPNVSERNYWGL